MRLLKHILVYLVKQRGNFLAKSVKRQNTLFVSIAAHRDRLSVFYIARTYLDTHGHALHFPLVEFPTGRLVPVVQLYAHTRIFKRGGNLASLFQYAFLMVSDRHDYNLHGRDSRRKLKSALVAVRHNKRAD